MMWCELLLAISHQQSAISKRQGQARFPFCLIGWLLAAGCWLLSQAVVFACPLCSQALFSPGETTAQVGALKGYLVSIVALLGLPLVMIGGIAVWVVRASRRTKSRALR